MFSNLRQHLCSFLYSTAKVHVSQAYIKMDMTRERVSFCLGLTNLLLPLQVDISFARAVVARALFERTSGLELHVSSETTAPRLLKSVILLMPWELCVISLVFSHLFPFYILYRYCRISSF